MDNIFVPQCMAIFAPFQQKKKAQGCKCMAIWVTLPIFPTAAFWVDD